MKGNLLDGNAANSKSVIPRAEVGVIARAKTGTITDWKIQVSADGTNWVDAGVTAFTATKGYDTFKCPQGFYMRLAGTAADVEVSIGYLAQARVSQIDIGKDIQE